MLPGHTRRQAVFHRRAVACKRCVSFAAFVPKVFNPALLTGYSTDLRSTSGGERPLRFAITQHDQCARTSGNRVDPQFLSALHGAFAFGTRLHPNVGDP